LLEAVSEDKRERVLGFGEEGRAQGLRELGRVELEVRWLRVSGDELARETLRELQRPAAIARLSFQVMALVVVVWTTVVARRRHRAWLYATRNAAAKIVRRPAALRALQRVTAA